MFLHPRHSLLAASTALIPLVSFPAAAGPNGGTVVGGSASIQGAGTGSVTVNQSSQNAIINWQTFNIGASETTRFNQPGSSSIALNRVVGGLGPSQILGTLTANGRVFVINGDGILFGPNAVVNTAGFLATTNDIRNEDFMAGRYNFTIPGRPSASIVNLGTITAASGGFAALVAPGVRNSGTITATLGTVSLAAGNGFTLDFYGDKLITLAVNDQIASQVIDVATGQPLKSLVGNEGKISANGGRVELTAAAARAVVDSVINNKGVIEANSIGTRSGMIVLGAATTASKPAGAPTQTVRLSGKISAAGKDKGTTSGKIQVTGEAIQLAGATLDASGVAGGGTVLVGGDWSGGHPTVGLVSNASAQLEPYWVPTATTVSVDAWSKIDASAKNTGNGGKVIVWADQSTAFNGMIFAQGGALSGDGGFVETSGKQSLSIQTGSVNTDAPHGKIGDWLLDPFGIAVSLGGAATLADVASFGVNPGTTQFISPNTIASAVSNVTLQAQADIFFEVPVTMVNNQVGITARAGGSIIVEPSAPITTRGGNITLIANDPGGPANGAGRIFLNAALITNGGGVRGGNVSLSVAGGSGDVLFTPSNANITTAGGRVTLGGTNAGIPVVIASADQNGHDIPVGTLSIDTTGAGAFSSGADINFTSRVTGGFVGRQLLTLTAGSGNIGFGGNVSVSGLTIASAHNVTASGFIAARSGFFTDTNQTGDLIVPGGISTRGVQGATVPGTENAGPINIFTSGNAVVGTDSNSFIVANGGFVQSTGAGGNGANVTIHAGGNVTLSGVISSGGIPKNGSTHGGDAGNISITGNKISILGYPSGTFSGVPNLTLIAIGAAGGPNTDTTAFLPDTVAGKGGNIALNGNVVLRGGAGTSVLFSNISNGPNKDIIISGQIDATTPGIESLIFDGGHGRISTGNIGNSVSLGSVAIRNNVTGSFGSVSATSLTRNTSTSNASFETIFGPSTTTFNGPVDISGDVTLKGANLIFANRLNVGGNAVIGSANLSAQSVLIGGHTRISSDTTIKTSQSNGLITFGAIDGTTPFTQSLTLNAGNQGRVTTGDVGDTVPLKSFTVIPSANPTPNVTPPTTPNQLACPICALPNLAAIEKNLVTIAVTGLQKAEQLFTSLFASSLGYTTTDLSNLNKATQQLMQALGIQSAGSIVNNNDTTIGAAECTTFVTYVYNYIAKKVAPNSPLTALPTGNADTWYANAPTNLKKDAGTPMSDLPPGTIIVWGDPYRIDPATGQKLYNKDASGTLAFPGHVAIITSNSQNKITLAEANWIHTDPVTGQPTTNMIDTRSLTYNQVQPQRISHPNGPADNVYFPLEGYILPPK